MALVCETKSTVRGSTQGIGSIVIIDDEPNDEASSDDEEIFDEEVT